jgi:hypothetical protein
MATAMHTLDADSALRRAGVSRDILLISRGAQQVVAQLTAARAQPAVMPMRASQQQQLCADQNQHTTEP